MSIKSIDLTDKQMRFLPLAGNILEIVASTKNKNATLKMVIPDEMFSLLTKLMMGNNMTEYQMMITYRAPNEKENDV